jgi:hypothetical protein
MHIAFAIVIVFTRGDRMAALRITSEKPSGKPGSENLNDQVERLGK